jgi:hypothetical protein
MSDILVFYAGQLYGEYSMGAFMRVTCESEVYNGAFLFSNVTDEWYRMDGTSILLEDVPKKIRAAVLLLT